VLWRREWELDQVHCSIDSVKTFFGFPHCVEMAKAYTYSFMGFARGPGKIDGTGVRLMECS